MGRKRLPDGLVRVDVKVRLPQYLVDEILKHGTKTEIIEKAVIKYLKINKRT